MTKVLKLKISPYTPQTIPMIRLAGGHKRLYLKIHPFRFDAHFLLF